MVLGSYQTSDRANRVARHSMGLIHMNGRVQDAVTGRFLSADPFVQAPFNGQSLNRYSYVFNNPLSYTDPSGFKCKDRDPNCKEEDDPNRREDDPNSDEPHFTVDGRPGYWPINLPGSGAHALNGLAVQRTVFRPQVSSPRSAWSDSTNSGAFTLADTLRSVSGLSYLRNEEPSALAELRRGHPALRQLEDELWQASLPSSVGLFLQRAGFPAWSGAREHAALIFQSTTNGHLLTFRQYAASAETPNAIGGDLTAPAGFRLIAIFHTHPFTYRTGNTRGPSPKDFETAIGSPSVFHYIRALGPVTGPYPGEWYYYGASAVTP